MRLWSLFKKKNSPSQEGSSPEMTMMDEFEGRALMESERHKRTEQHNMRFWLTPKGWDAVNRKDTD